MTGAATSPPTAAPRPAGRRGLAVTTLATAVASAVVLFAATRNWDTVMTHQVSPLPPMTQHRTGTQMSPWLPALGAVGLAGAGALLATRGRLRTIVGGLLALAGIGLVVAVIETLRHGVDVGWPLLTIVAAAVVVVAGGVTIRYSDTWPEMGARYERPATGTTAKPRQTELWDALDRGEDPTADK
ncbi:Trp biosynthesis-associated membrane protein [Dactylosporangium sp. NPDC005555]|uniref:Trp biosynthesis-associated membrane protein n=1 Tax=Dactylosporangium sp. NPDC005555 TaxID=3154889 RepID=UPI0033AC1D57